MARISRRIGPPANFEITGVDQLVPGMAVTRHFDDGEVLVLGQMQVLNGTAISRDPAIELSVDGVIDPNIFGQPNIPAGAAATCHLEAVIPISQGVHTIAMACIGTNTLGDVVFADHSVWTVIQLPQWDSEADIL